jgi:hypothetical protein
MHSSSSERPSSAAIDARERTRASSASHPDAPRRARAPMPTLIGVAPAAPIAGRPDLEHGAPVDDLLHPLSSPPSDSVASHDPPLSCVRPRVDQPGLAARIVTAPAASPKHTLDAISIGEEPVASRRRNRAAGIVVTMATVISLVLVGRRLAARDAPVSRPTSAPPAAAATTPLSVAAPPETQPAPSTPPSATPIPDPAPAVANAASDPADVRATVAPKPRHSKPPVRRKGSTPPRAH